MTISFGVVLYIMIWWMTLFAVLPLGVRTQGEAGDVVAGTPESAPAKPRILRAMLINTVVAAFVFALVWAALQNDWLGLYASVEQNLPAGVSP
jgi:predicted secreted protein